MFCFWIFSLSRTLIATGSDVSVLTAYFTLCDNKGQKEFRKTRQVRQSKAKYQNSTRQVMLSVHKLTFRMFPLQAFETIHIYQLF